MVEDRRFWLALGVASVTSLVDAYFGFARVSGYILAVIGGVLLVRFILFVSRKGRFTPDILMSTVAIVTSLTGNWFEGSIVMVLYSIAELMEEAAEELAKRRLTGLIKLVPSRVEVLRGGRAEKASISEVKPGDIVYVRKGEAVPVDGILLDRGVFDTKFVTGEPVPVELQPGDAVASGFINVGSPVRVRAVKLPSESTLQRLVEASLEFLERKSRVERLVERITPPMTVLVLSASLAAFWLYGIPGLVSVLVAGCPSAYIISASTSTMLTVAALARRGVVVKGGPPLEASKRVRAVVLDKTGTLTLGSPKLAKIVPEGMEEEVLSLAASAALASLHPLSRAIISEARARGITPRPPEDAEEYPGKGVRARVDGRVVMLGSKGFVGYQGNAECDGPIVYVASDGLKGYLCFRDEVTEDAVKTVKTLKSMGLRVVLASGDKRENVERAARRVGVEEYYYSMKPDDKVALVERLRRETGGVAMVGDGVNDIEALAAADLGIAVGSIDVVADVADAVVSRISQVVEVVRSGRAYYNAVIIAFVTASLIKAVAIVGGISGVLPLWLVAFLGDDGSTITGVAFSAVAIALSFKRL